VKRKHHKNCFILVLPRVDENDCLRLNYANYAEGTACANRTAIRSYTLPLRLF